MRALALSLLTLFAGCNKTGIHVTLTTQMLALDGVDQVTAHVTQAGSAKASQPVSFSFEPRTFTAGQPISFVLLFDGSYSGDVSIDLTLSSSTGPLAQATGIHGTISPGEIVDLNQDLEPAMANCDATTCPNGCCDLDGTCQTVESDALCGSNGVGCMQCSGGAHCMNLACMSPVGCGPGNCPDGCCDMNGQCQTIETDQVCGTGGQACLMCGGGDNCSQTSHVCCPGGAC